MMKSMMTKTTIREIKQSLGRYLAIVAIIALGVGFFAGLKITRQVMVTSADQYLEEQQFYDYRLLSTLGFEDEDVAALAEKPDARAVSGAYSADIICVSEDDSESVLKIHSLTDGVNGVKLLAGEMPASPDECVVDGNLYPEDAIGTKIVLADSNSEDDLEQFTYREYTITGIVQSSLYIQFERGNTSLGNGRISGFAYLLPEGFQMDYFTEIYVKLDNDDEIYSDEYENYIDAKQSEWEDYCEAQGLRRYQSIMDEAEGELADAEDELADKRAEAEGELSDAKQELLDAEVEIADGEQQLLDAEKELSDAEETILKNEADLATARKNLEENELLLAQLQANALYTQSEELAMQAAYMESQLTEARAQLEAGEKEIADAREELADARAEIEEKKQELADAKVEVEDGWAEYNDANAEFETEIADAEEELADARAEIADIEEPDTYVLGRDTNIGYVCFESDSSIVDGIANVFPVFFFLVAALVCMTTMNRMVEEQRTQIGVLKALGYGEASIMGKYLFYSGSAALVGCLVGYFAFIHLFPLVIWIAYGLMYELGDIQYAFDWKLLTVSLVVSLACSMGTTWFSCRHEMKSVAAELMRPKAPKAGKRTIFERIPFFWNRLKFLQKVSVRNIVRYKKRFFMMVFGISGCTALLVTGYGIMDSIANIASQQFDQIQIYDMNIALQDGDEDTDELTGLIEEAGGTYSLGYEASIDLVTEDGIKTINLVVAENPDTIGEYIHLYDGAENTITYPGTGEAVISDKLADMYDYHIGDEILLRDEDQNTIRATVSGIFTNFIYNYVYLNTDTYTDVFDSVSYKNMYVNLPQETDIHEASAAFMQAENVASVSVSADIKVRFSSMMGSLNYIVYVIILCAAALAFVVLYNLNNINITERIREIATIKVLGFYRKETASYVFRENMVLTAIGCFVGLFLGKLLHAYVMSQVNIDMVSFDVHVEAISYVYSVLLTFLFNWVVNRIMSGKLDRINMAESLKSVD